MVMFDLSFYVVRLVGLPIIADKRILLPGRDGKEGEKVKQIVGIKISLK